jgi:hypothetical protein
MTLQSDDNYISIMDDDWMPPPSDWIKDTLASPTMIASQQENCAQNRRKRGRDESLVSHKRPKNARTGPFDHRQMQMQMQMQMQRQMQQTSFTDQQNWYFQQHGMYQHLGGRVAPH